MKTNIRSKALLLGATLLGTILFTGTKSAAAILQTVNQTGADANGWAAAIWGTPAAMASGGNDYETAATFAVRTPNNSTPAAFAGQSLQIDAGGILYLKHAGGAASVNLLMNGGNITFHGGTATTASPLAGTMQVLADSLINTDQSSPNNRDIWLQSTISGSANLTVAMVIATNSVILSGNNSAYSGNWTNTSGFIQIVSGTTNALGSGTVTLTGSGTTSLTFNSTNNFAVNNTISGPGYLVKLNTNTVTLNGNNTFTGSVRITNGVIQLGASSAITNASAIVLAGGTLDASQIGGLTLNAGIGQNMNCNGRLISNLTAATANTLNFNLTPTTNDILNITGSLTLNGNPTNKLTVSGYKPSGTYRLINYSGTIQGGGSFVLVPPVGSSETFQLDTSIPGQVNLIVTGTPNNLIWVGDGGANYWDMTSFNWSNGTATNFSIGDNVTFNDSGPSSVEVFVAVTPGNVTVSNTVQSYQFISPNLVGISTVGTLTKAGSNELDLANPGNNFNGPIDIQAGVLSIGTGGSFGSLGNPSSITNNGVLRVNMASGGLTLNAPISGSGSVEVTGATTVFLSGTNSYAGPTTIGDGCQLNITTSTALGTTDAGTTVLANGRLGVASLVGDLTVPEPIVVSGTGVAVAPGALYVNTVGNNITWAGPVTIAGDTRFRAVNANVRMNFSNSVLGTDVALQCTVGGAASDTNTVMTFLNTFSLGSGTLTKDGQGIVAFNSANNVCGSVIINGGTVQANGVLNGGPVTVSSTATFGGSGTNLGPVSVLAGGNLAPGNSGIGTLTLNNTLSLDPASATVMKLNRTNAQNADLLVAASVPFNGTLTVVNVGPALQTGDTFNLFDGAISGTFAATNLPTLGSPGYYWDTSLLASQGIIKVASNVAPTPAITSPSINGANFTLQVAASANGFNYVLEATPALAPATWIGIQTNAGNGGTLSFTNMIIPGTPQQFFRINVQ